MATFWHTLCTKPNTDAHPQRSTLKTSDRKRLRTTNHVERVNQELKRRGRTVRIWPNPASRDRLYGALLMEQHERWVGITWLKQEGA